MYLAGCVAAASATQALLRQFSPSRELEAPLEQFISAVTAFCKPLSLRAAPDEARLPHVLEVAGRAGAALRATGAVEERRRMALGCCALLLSLAAALNAALLAHANCDEQAPEAVCAWLQFTQQLFSAAGVSSGGCAEWREALCTVLAERLGRPDDGLFAAAAVGVALFAGDDEVPSCP